MARDFDGYSKAINWLKVVLPIVGLGILSTLFLVARETRIAQRDMPGDAFSPDGAVETMVAPDYAGITGDGTRVSVTAGTVWPKPDGGGDFEAADLRATFDLAGGDRAEVRAERGTLRPAEDVLALRKDVVVTTDSGWVVESEALDAQLDWTRLTSPTDVRITEGPIGTLEAGNMLITRDTGATGSYLMEFDGGVDLVYRP